MKSRQNVNTILTGKRTGRVRAPRSRDAGSIYTDKVSGQNKTENTANLKNVYKIISLWLWVKVYTLKLQMVPIEVLITIILHFKSHANLLLIL